MPTAQDSSAAFTPAIPTSARSTSATSARRLARDGRICRGKRGDLIVIGLLYPIICVVAAVVTFNDLLLRLFCPLVAGLSIAGPAAASGFYELARRREEGRDSRWWHFRDLLNGRSRLPLAMLTAGFAALFIDWLFVAYAIYAVTFGADALYASATWPDDCSPRTPGGR